MTLLLLFIPPEALHGAQRRLGVQPNIYIALHRLVNMKDAELALRLSAAMWQYWQQFGIWDEAFTWFNRALSTSPTLSTEAFLVAKATALYRLGLLTNYKGDMESATKLCQESLSIFQAIQDRHGTYWAQYALASVAMYRGHSTEAATNLGECLAGFREYSDSRGIIWTLNDLGLVAEDQGNYAQARSLFEGLNIVYNSWRIEWSDRSPNQCWLFIGRIGELCGSHRTNARRFRAI